MHVRCHFPFLLLTLTKLLHIDSTPVTLMAIEHVNPMSEYDTRIVEAKCQTTLHAVL